MGSSDKETGVVDCSVGAIVWVRRRNGSWWPGKILGADELSAAHLMSPRSGTPVKLLGREDASVDWYNLEKSKRVKAFRCGEFDDCIERAESSQGMPPKKREKYARREDAILHALELEKELLEKKYGKLGCSSNGKSSKSSDAGKEELETSSECLDDSNQKHARPKSHQVSKILELPLENKNMGHPLNAQKAKDGNQQIGDDDNSVVLPRMRGLQDIGLRIAPSRRKLSSSVASNGSQKTAIDNNAHAPRGGDLSTGSTVHASIENSLEKMKRSNDGLAEDSLVRRRDKRRPLVQVLQSSTKLLLDRSLQPDSGIVSMSVSEEELTGVMSRAKRSRFVLLPGESGDCLEDTEIYPNQMELSPSRFEESNSPCPAASGEENTSESMEDTETDSSDTDSLDLDADAVVLTELEPKFVRRSEAQPEHGSTSSEDPDDLGLTGDMSHLSPNDPVSSGVGVSKWQLKGKRKNRSLTKRYADMSDGKVHKGSICGINREEERSNGCDEVDVIERNFKSRMSGFDNRGYSFKSTSGGPDSFSPKIIDWEDVAWSDQSALKGFWEESGSCFDPVFVGRRHVGGKRKSMLVEVDLKVQSGYQREHVPMISLMSKLNGQAIVGHPIQIEALEDGASEIFVSEADNFCTDILDNDTALPPVWRTARRTANFRVPRPHPSTTPDGDETSEHLKHLSQDRKILSKKSSAGSHRAITMRKSLSHVAHPPIDKKLNRKPPKKISLSSNQKIRTLSSIATERKLGNDPKRGGSSYQVDGLIKPESGPTAVACIPVKLVFSRLYEELVGRHQ